MSTVFILSLRVAVNLQKLQNKGVSTLQTLSAHCPGADSLSVMFRTDWFCQTETTMGIGLKTETSQL